MPAFACAHRGLSSQKAENTLAAFRAAAEAGFPAVEMDLRCTADDEVVVLHDATVERTTGGKGRVDSLTSRALAALATRNGPVPQLGELLAAMAGWNGLWNFEIKHPAALSGTLSLVRQRGLAGRALLSAMDPAVLEQAQLLAPEVPRGFIALGPLEDDDLAAAKVAGCRWVNADHDFLDADGVARIRQAGFRLGAYTVNDPARAAELVRLGVECIITDRREVLNEVGRPTASW
ncbi:MAG: glycerophosphodiester phosphodiesterase family protein [Candidatus Thermoplasmatota archaeon]